MREGARAAVAGAGAVAGVVRVGAGEDAGVVEAGAWGGGKWGGGIRAQDGQDFVDGLSLWFFVSTQPFLVHERIHVHRDTY